jgi:hypothetical protein
MIWFGITSQMEALVIGESLNVKNAAKSIKNFLGSMGYNVSHIAEGGNFGAENLNLK